MVTGAQIEAQRRLQQRITAQAKRALAEWVAEQDTGDARRFRDLLTEFLYYLARRYGDAAAAAAADFYEASRAAAGVTVPFEAVLAEAVAEEEAARAAFWAVGPLFGAEPDRAAMLSRAQQPLGRWVKQAEGRTVMRSADRDPARPRVVRVPRGDETCAFCIMLASRGELDTGYTSRLSAVKVLDPGRPRYDRSELADFHDDCDCEAVTIFPGEPDPPGWDSERYAALYRSATNRVGSKSDTSAILAAMREMHGLH